MAMPENAEVGPSSAEVPVLFCFAFTCKTKSFLWNFFSTQAALSPLTFIGVLFYAIVFHALPFQRVNLEMTDSLKCSSREGSFRPGI